MASHVISRRGVFCGAAFVAAIVVAHQYLLSGIAGWLVSEDRDPEGTWGLVVDGDRCSSVAAGLVQQGTLKHVLLISSPPGRLQQIGVLPAWDNVIRGELLRQDVPATVIETLHPGAEDGWDDAKTLERWLDRHPDQRVLVFRERFASQRQRVIYNRELSPQNRARVAIVALPDRRYDETNLWKGKVGIKAFFRQWFCLSCERLVGPRQPRKRSLTAQEYEDALFR